MMPPITGDPYRDGFNIGYAVGVLVGVGSTTLLCVVLATFGVFA